MSSLFFIPGTFISYIILSDNLFTFEGNMAPHGHYDVMVFYDSDKEIPKKDLKRHYGKLLEIILED